jgi:hypothetical protein
MSVARRQAGMCQAENAQTIVRPVFKSNLSAKAFRTYCNTWRGCNVNIRENEKPRVRELVPFHHLWVAPKPKDSQFFPVIRD